MWGFQEQGGGQLLEWHNKECRCTWQREPSLPTPGNRTVVCLICTSRILIYGSNWVATWRGQYHWKILSLTFPEERGCALPHRAPWGSAKVWSGGRKRSKGKVQARAFTVLTTGKAKQGNGLWDWLLWIMLMGSGLQGWSSVIWYLAPGCES